MKESDIIFGLMATSDKEEFSINDLKYLVKPFKITESCLRTNLSRMRRKDLLKSRRDGKRVYYSFGKRGKTIKSNVALSFKSLDRSRWNNSWWGMLFSVPDIKKSKRYYIRKKLLAYRFVSLYPGFWIRPFNEKENIKDSLKNLIGNKFCRIIKFYYFYNISNEEVKKLWKLDEVNRSFKYGLRIIKKSREKLKTLSPDKGLIEEIIVGGKIVKILFKDPLLPKKFLSIDWQGEELKEKFSIWIKEIKKISKPYWEKIFK